MAGTWQMDEAELAIASGDWDEARAMIEARLAVAPHDGVARRMLMDVRALAEWQAALPSEEPQPTPSTPAVRAPEGVQLVALAVGLVGLVQLILLPFALLSMPFPFSLLPVLAGIVAAALHFVVARGLFRLRTWAWWAVVIVCGASVWHAFAPDAGGARSLPVLAQFVVLIYFLHIGRTFGQPERRLEVAS